MRIELQTSIKWWKGGFGGTRENRRQYVWRLGPPQPTKMSAFVLSDHFTAFTLPSAHTVPSNLFFPCLDKLALLGLAPYPPPSPSSPTSCVPPLLFVHSASHSCFRTLALPSSATANEAEVFESAPFIWSVLHDYVHVPENTNGFEATVFVDYTERCLIVAGRGSCSTRRRY